jgi:hypothetical protein
MATVTARGPTVQARPAGGTRRPPDVCRLTLTIRGDDYRARVLPADRSTGVVALVRLRKLDGGEVYHVARHGDGLVTCECADYHFRHEGQGTACKHARALSAAGLLPGGGAR